MKMRICQFLFALLTMILVAAPAVDGQIRTAGQKKNSLERIPLDDDVRLSGAIKAPVFCPANPYLLAYERQVQTTEELYLYNSLSGEIREVTITAQVRTKKQSDFLDLTAWSESDEEPVQWSRYDGQLSWRPVKVQGKCWFVFVHGSAEEENDLYLSYVDESGALAERSIRLKAEGVEHSPQWSPDGNRLVFTSTGKGDGAVDLFLAEKMDLLLQSADASLFTPRRITNDDNEDAMPVWSPSGKFIAYASQASEQGVKNFGIRVINMIDLQAKPFAVPIAVTPQLYRHNEYRPSWAPNEANIAFYMDQTPFDQNTGNRIKDIGIATLSPDKSLQRIEEGSFISGLTPHFAENVLVSNHRGPLWLEPEADEQFILYVQKSEEEKNPIKIREFNSWLNRNRKDAVHAILPFGTDLNREIAFTRRPDDRAFCVVSLVKNEFQMQLLKWPYAEPRDYFVLVEKDRKTAMVKSLLPGLGQRYKGEKRKGLILTVATGTTALAALYHFLQLAPSYDESEKAASNYNSKPLSLNKRNELLDRYTEWEHEYEAWSRYKKRTLVFGATALGLYAYNLIDSYLGFPLVVPERFTAQRGPQKPAILLQPDCRLAWRQGEPVYLVGARIQF